MEPRECESNGELGVRAMASSMVLGGRISVVQGSLGLPRCW